MCCICCDIMEYNEFNQMDEKKETRVKTREKILALLIDRPMDAEAIAKHVSLKRSTVVGYYLKPMEEEQTITWVQSGRTKYWGLIK